MLGVHLFLGVIDFSGYKLALVENICCSNIFLGQQIVGVNNFMGLKKSKGKYVCPNSSICLSQLINMFVRSHNMGSEHLRALGS
jgi:hypothetical protein